MSGVVDVVTIHGQWEWSFIASRGREERGWGREDTLTDCYGQGGRRRNP